MIDLHVHSTYSDGTYSPVELVEYAYYKNLKAFALTDHDTIDGIKEAQVAAKTRNLTVIPGVELSTDHNGQEIHILGLFIDPTNSIFANHLEQFNQERTDRNQKMIALLQQQGVSITLAEMERTYPSSILTRAHFARFLLDHHYVSSIQNAFELYLGNGCPCYVPRHKVSPKDAISVIRNAKGYPILAHPLLYHMDQTALTSFVKHLKENGLAGIEAIYSLHSKEEEAMLIRLAKEQALFITGGSDFHGSNKPDIDLGTGKGTLEVPDTLLTQFDPA